LRKAVALLSLCAACAFFKALLVPLATKPDQTVPHSGFNIYLFAANRCTSAPTIFPALAGAFWPVLCSLGFFGWEAFWHGLCCPGLLGEKFHTPVLLQRAGCTPHRRSLSTRRRRAFLVRLREMHQFQTCCATPQTQL
jgi:hypothetical protein